MTPVSSEQHHVFAAHLSLSSFSLTPFQDILWKKERQFPLELAVFLLVDHSALPASPRPLSQVKWENIRYAVFLLQS